MKVIKIMIERSSDAYWAYAENVGSLNGVGDTVQEAKSIFECIDILKGFDNPPAILQGEYELVFKFDTESFLKYYKGIFTNAAFEHITGINQRQIQHYSTGLKKPRPAQRKKIETALHQLGNELLAVEL